MAAGGQSDCNDNDEGFDEPHASQISLMCIDGRISTHVKQEKSGRNADVQTWRWKIEDGGVSDLRHTKETHLGHNVSKRRAQNRAAQKAFRDRQRKTYREVVARNEELNSSLKEAQQKINRLCSIVESLSLEMKTDGATTTRIDKATERSMCSAKCHSRVLQAQAISHPSPNLVGKENDETASEHMLNARPLRLHTNACLFKSTTTEMSKQHTVQSSSRSNKAVSPMHPANKDSIASADPPPKSVPDPEGFLEHYQATTVQGRPVHQTHTGEAAYWQQPDTSVMDGQDGTSAGFESLASSFLRETEQSCANLMHYSSCMALKQGLDCYNTGSSNTASMPARDDATLDTRLTSPDSTGEMLRFLANAPQFHSQPNNDNGLSSHFFDPVAAAPADFSDLAIAPCLGLGEVNWFEAPY